MVDKKTTILGNTVNKDQAKILSFKVDNSIGPNGFATGSSIEKDKQLYPLVSGLPKEQTDAHIDSGIMGPVWTATEAETWRKSQEVYTSVIETSSLDQRPPEEALAELETLRNENPILKQFISPATIAMLKQSENPTARRMAQNKITNVFIAAGIIAKKVEENPSWSANTLGDFADVMVSDLPVVSLMNVENRKDLSSRFVQILASNESPEIVSKELEAIIDEASDMGFFTDNNRFYLNDFISLIQEGTTGSEAALQEGFAGLDILLGLGVIGDAGKLASFTRRSFKEVKTILDDAILKDDALKGHSNPASYGESISDTMKTPTLPAESTAFKDTILEHTAWKAAVEARIASGKAIAGPEWDTFSKSIEADFKARADAAGVKSYIDADVVIDDFDNVVLKETYGTKKGTAYKRKQDAQRVADDILGTVVPSADGSGFVIEKATNIPLGEFSTAGNAVGIANDLRAFRTTDPTELLDQSFYGKWFASSSLQTTPYLDALLKRGEAARAAASFTVMKDFNKAVKAAKVDGVLRVQKVVTDIRDGALANVRPWLNMPEFSQRFLELNKRLPTQAEKDVYQATVELADVNWRITADFHMKREVNKGIEIFKFDDLDVAGAKVQKTEALAGRMAWDFDAKKFVKISDVDDTVSIVRLVEPMEFGKQLTDLIVTKTSRSRALKPEDVLGYNAGGSRLYRPNQTNFIIKQSQETKLVDGKVIEGRPTTIMVAKTEKESRKALGEINGILETIHKIYDPKGITKFDYLQIMKGQASNDVLNNAVRAANGFNKQITDIADFVEFFESMGLDLRKTVDVVGDGEPLVKNSDFLGDLTFRDALTAPGKLKRGDVRRDSVLIGYGGKALDTIPPLESIRSTTMATVAKSTNVAYEQAAINGLLKKLLIGDGKQSLVAPKTIEEIRFLPLRQKVKALEGKIFTSTRDGKKLELERQKIVYRLEKQSYLDGAYAERKDALGNLLYDKGWEKTSKFIDGRSADPVAGARGIVFDAYLGMFAPDQLMVQAQQMYAVMAMADHFEGIKAVAFYPYLRKMVYNGHDAPIKEVSKYTAGILGVSSEQAAEIAKSFMQSGRWATQAALADLGEDAAGPVFLGKVRSAGRMFYNEGELISRMTAHTAASLEFFKKFPGKSLLTEEGRNYVAHRADVMTASMTSMSRGPLEQLPFMQFMSYQFRMGEQLLAGTLGGKALLTPAKRAKLAIYQMAFYGASAVPAVGAYMDWYQWKYGEPFDAELYGAIREGGLDTAIKVLTDIETEFGRRVGWGEGLFNTIDNLVKGNVFTSLAGPAGTFSGTLMDAIVKMRTNITYGGGTLLAEDAFDVLRSIKSVNLAYNAIVAYNYGEYRLRDGTVVRDDIDTKEAAAIAMGIPLEKMNEVWRDIKFLKKDKGYYQDRAKVISSLYADHLAEIRANGQSERARKIQEAISEAYRQESPFARAKIDSYVDKDIITLNEELILQILKTDSARRQEVMN